MENEHLNREPIPQHKGPKKQKVDNCDLKFVRSVLEKTCRQIKPKTSNSVMWGLICMIIYVGAHFLAKNQLYNWIRPLMISLISLGIICTLIQSHFLFKELRQQGFVPQLLSSVLYGLPIILLPVIFFDLIGLFKGMHCESAFIYALTINTIMILLGVAHSKLWFSGTFLVIAGILAAFIVKDYSLLILGITTGTGIILSAVTVDFNYRKMEENHG